MSTEKYRHHRKVEFFYYLVGMFGPLNPVNSISAALRKLLPGDRRGSQATHKFATKEEGNLNIKDQIADKGISHSMYGRMQASGLTEFTPSTCTSAVWGQILFLVHLKEWQMAASRIPPAPQQKCSWLGTEQD